MNKNGNVKVVIAIVIMLIVSLSVVGFTYAYFNTQLQGNKENTSIEVGSGTMKVDFEFGQILKARNIVPGWISDEYHYYDPVLSIVDEKNETTGEVTRKITAATLDVGKVLKKDAGLTTAPKFDDDNPLVAKPVSFTVKNTGDVFTKYAINLNVTKNEFITDDFQDDADNLVVYLIKSEDWKEGELSFGSAPLTETAEIKLYTIDEDSGKKIMNPIVTLDAYEYLAVGTSQSYYIVLGYKNNPDVSQNDSMKKIFQANVEIVGLGQYAKETTTTKTLPQD